MKLFRLNKLKFINMFSPLVFLNLFFLVSFFGYAEEPVTPTRKIVFLTSHWRNPFDPKNLEPMRLASYRLEPMLQFHETAIKAGYTFQPALREPKILMDYSGRVIENFDLLVVFDIYPHQHAYLKNYPKEKLILFLWEPPSVSPQSYDPSFHSIYSKIYTWHDDLVDNQRYFKLFYPVILPKDEELIPFNDKNLCALVATNRAGLSNHPQELYKERLKVVQFYEKNHPKDFDVYGRGWSNQYKCYKGMIQDKIETLKHYKFCICYENIKGIPGYISEKIFDCFQANCVPVYLGASNISTYIPENCYIAREKFNTDEDLYQHLQNMDEKEYNNYLKNIDLFFKSPEAEKFSFENFVKTAMKAIQ